MKVILDCEIPIEPRGKGRPRFGGRVVYTDQKTKKYEMDIKSVASVLVKKKASEKPMLLNIIAKISIPQSWPQWKKMAALNGRIAPTGTPDKDNIEKAVCDALNGVCWVDDSQIVGGETVKVYSEKPSIRIVVKEMIAAPSSVKTKGNYVMHGFVING